MYKSTITMKDEKWKDDNPVSPKSNDEYSLIRKRQNPLKRRKKILKGK